MESVYTLTERPRVIEASDGARSLVLFPTRPYWFAVEGPIRPLLDAIAAGNSRTGVIERYLAAGDGDNRSARDVDDILSLLEQGGVLRVDGIPTGAEVIRVASRLARAEDVCVISVTMACNLRCPHCFIDSRGKLDEELTRDEIRHVVRQLKSGFMPPSDVVPYVHLTGGEPFIRRDLRDIIADIRSEGFLVSISSNALLITAEMARFLGENDVVLSISLDGATATTHELVRGPGTFARTVKSIRQLTEAGVRVGINHFVHQGNFHELEETIGLVRQLGAEGFNPIPLEHIGRARESSDFAAVPDRVIYRTLFDLCKTRAWLVELLRYSSPLANMVLAVAAGLRCTYCGVGTRRNLFVQSNGDVFACANTCRASLVVGNVRQTPLLKLYEESPVLRAMRTLNVESLNPSCANCDVRYFCGGDCRGEAHANTGSLTRPSINCGERRKAIVEVLWILAEQPDLFAENVSDVVGLARSRNQQGLG